MICRHYKNIKFEGLDETDDGLDNMNDSIDNTDDSLDQHQCNCNQGYL